MLFISLLCLLSASLALEQQQQVVSQEELTQLKNEINEIRQDLKDVLAAVSSHVKTVEARFDDVTHKVDDVVSTMTTDPVQPTPALATGGGLYTKWGRTLCGLNGGDLVYSGQMGGPDSSFEGSASNLVCLPNTPEYQGYMPGSERDTPGRGVMVVAEYKGNPNEIFDFDNLNGASFLDENIPCAVCLLTNQSNVVMIPANRFCPAGWNMVYWGYLMSSVYDGYYQSTYECIEHAPEVSNGGTGTTGVGTFLYHVEGVCGSSLPCPDYVDNWELTCVVCSR